MERSIRFRLDLLLCAALLVAVPAAAQTADPAVDSLPVLSYSEALRIAREVNRDILIARNEARIARNDNSLGNAGYLPVVGVQAQQAQRPGAGGAEGGGRGGGTTVDLQGTLTYTVFDGFRRNATRRRLGVLEQQFEIAAELSTESILGDVAFVYYDIAGQQQQIAALREAIAISEERLRIAELRRDVGSGSELGVRQARVDLNADRAALLRQQAMLAAAKTRLNQLLARARGLRYRVADSIPIDRSLQLDSLVQDALSGNRDLRVAEQARAAASFARREERAAWLPAVGLQLGYAFSDLPNGIGLTAQQPEGLSYGVVLSWDVWDGWERDRRIQNARIREQNRELEMEQVRTRVLAELEGTWEEFRTRLALVALEEENVALARDNVALALERFRLGLSTSVELREAQNAFTDALTRRVRARVEAKQAETILLELSGDLLDRVT